MNSDSPSTIEPWERRWLRAFVVKPVFRRAALVAFVGSFFMPTTGLGADLCPLHAATGLPCGGCGVTRGLALVSQGHFAEALGANPFVLFLWPGLLILAALALVPQRRVEAMEARLDVLEPGLSATWRVLLFAFFGFGLIRFLVFLVLGERFP